jgi:hypothetical protein
MRVYGDKTTDYGKRANAKMKKGKIEGRTTRI